MITVKSEIRPSIFDSWCIKCENWIEEGDGVQYDPDYGEWVHGFCNESEE